jgi:hypothetical protein
MGSGIIEIWEAHKGRGIFLAHPNPIQLMHKRKHIHRKLFIMEIITFQRACVFKKGYAIFGNSCLSTKAQRDKDWIERKRPFRFISALPETNRKILLESFTPLQ